VANNPWLAVRSKVLDWFGESFFESPEFRAYHIFHDEIHATLRYLKALEDLRAGREGRFHTVPHHVAHMASSFLLSPFDRAAILDMDGRGEVSTSAQGEGRGNAIDVFRVDHMPNSLGLLYAAVSDFLGFTGQDDEFRVMSISSQGEPSFRDKFREVVRLLPDGAFQLDPAYFLYREGLAALSERFIQAFGGRRGPGEPILQRHRDIAASLQRTIEEAVLHAAEHLRKKTGLDDLCFTGGVALNWVVNGRLASEGPYRRVHVNPAAGDEGTAIGAALHVWAQSTGARPEPLASVGLGPAYTDAEIEQTLRCARLAYVRVPDAAAEAARRLAKGEIVGWFEGRSEFGPRGLGHRAILAHPSQPETKARLLRDVKPREDHHPFGLSIVQERAADVFEGGRPSPYMLLWDRVQASHREALRSTISSSGICRWQGVDAAHEPAFHALLTAFGQATGGLPALINTSLNLPGRPQAVHPREAIEVFAVTGLDALVMGPFVIAKSR
jgi:carbamoyltransferase